MDERRQDARWSDANLIADRTNQHNRHGMSIRSIGYMKRREGLAFTDTKNRALPLAREEQDFTAGCRQTIAELLERDGRWREGL